MESWLLVLVLAIVLNVIPAFMPPTWSLLAYFHLSQGLAVAPLALVGAIGATTGRALLALISRFGGERFVPGQWRANITVLADAIRSRPALSVPTLGLFALGPVPSNHLFIAAGLANVALTPLLAIFAVARFVSYLIWVNAASTAAATIQEAIGPRWGGGVAIAVQLAGFLLLIFAMQVDWARHLQRCRLTREAATRGGAGPSPQDG